MQCFGHQFLAHARLPQNQHAGIGPGDLLGEMALIDSKPRSASALTRSTCRIAPVGEERFLQMVQETPHFSLHVMRILADRLRRTTAKV